MTSSGLMARGLVVDRGGRRVLDGVDLQVGAGCLVAVTGPNGSGKSTLLLALAGLVDLVAGEVLLEGARLHAGRAPAPRAQRRRVSLVLQEPWLSRGRVSQHLDLAARLAGRPRAEGRRLGRSLLEMLGIEALSERSTAELSGGERSLVALAASLLQQTPLLLLDEPTASLAEPVARQVEGLLRQRAQAGAVVVVATHDGALAERLGVGLRL